MKISDEENRINNIMNSINFTILTSKEGKFSSIDLMWILYK